MSHEFGTSSGDYMIGYGIDQNGFMEVQAYDQILYKDSHGEVKNGKLTKPESLTDEQWKQMTTRSKRLFLMNALAIRLKGQKPPAEVLREIQDTYGFVQGVDHIFL